MNIEDMKAAESLIADASANELTLICQAIEKLGRKTPTIRVYPYHRAWAIGEYEISHSLRHATFDVCQGNLHKACCNSLNQAVGEVLRLQGWTCDDAAARSIVWSMERDCVDLVEKAKMLHLLKPEE